ncbi:MAG TPA: 50S ribosomal protein L22 [Candidatus Saccharimonadales bacterium]|nr:50S ribosomal protein L22 [Candidatus Saccharimonadales bacterium]
MEKTYISTQKFIRMSPKKIRVVVEAVKKMSPEKAVEVLPYVGKKSAEPLQKTIKSAIANARMQGAKTEELIFKEIQIGEGPRLKRGMAASRGRYHKIIKRMSHIRVVLTVPEKKEEKKEIKKEVKKVEKKGKEDNGTKS